MTLLSLDMPTDSNELALWLESHFVGQTLGALVSELVAVHGHKRDFQIDHLIRNCKAELLAEGLQSLTGKQLLLLITNPSLLGDLQAIVLAEGGAYWQQQLRNTWQGDSSYQQGARLLHDLAGSGSVQPTRKRLARFQDQRWAMRLLATSALLLVGFLGWRLVEPGGGRATAWGWNSPSLFEATDSSVGYLEKLADAAEEWFDERPETRSDLALRINELRTGCSRLIRADHKSLSLADRKWLVARCQAWATKIDESLAELESGSSPQVVRNQVDNLIRKLSETLRNGRVRDPASQVTDHKKLLYGEYYCSIKVGDEPSANQKACCPGRSSSHLVITLCTIRHRFGKLRDRTSLDSQIRQNYSLQSPLAATHQLTPEMI